MRTASLILAGILSATAKSAAASDFEAQRAVNAMHDAARAQERTARSLERIAQQDQDRARDTDRARHNAEVLSRSSRRFDR